MTERTGIVIEIDNKSGRHAHVMTDRKSACGGCDARSCHVIKSACFGCLSSTKVVSRVANPVGAKVGDMVKIKLPAAKLFTAAAIFYLIPVFSVIIGAFSGASTFQSFEVSESIASIGGAGIGLFVAMLLVAILGRLPQIGRRIEPAISAIVRSNAVQ